MTHNIAPPRFWTDTLDFDPAKIREGIALGRKTVRKMKIPGESVSDGG